MLKSQMNLDSLRTLGADIVDWVVRILGWQDTTMFKNLGDIPDVPFLNFVKFTMVDFLLKLFETPISERFRLFVVGVKQL